MSEHPIAAIIGAVSGLIVAGYVLFYIPMRANYERNGCVWLVCEPSAKGATDA